MQGADPEKSFSTPEWYEPFKIPNVYRANLAIGHFLLSHSAREQMLSIKSVRSTVRQPRCRTISANGHSRYNRNRTTVAPSFRRNRAGGPIVISRTPEADCHSNRFPIGNFHISACEKLTRSSKCATWAGSRTCASTAHLLQHPSSDDLRRVGTLRNGGFGPSVREVRQRARGGPSGGP